MIHQHPLAYLIGLEGVTVRPDELPEPLTPGPPDIWELHPYVADVANAARDGQPAVVAWDFELRLP